jgi:hypothetical protein
MPVAVEGALGQFVVGVPREHHLVMILYQTSALIPPLTYKEAALQYKQNRTGCKRHSNVTNNVSRDYFNAVYSVETRTEDN